MEIISLAERAIQAYEALAQLRICVHDLQGSLSPYLDPSRFTHNSPVCRQVKEGPYGQRCWEFEVPELRRDLDQLQRTNGRVHRCHVGLLEWVVPVIVDKKVSAILFAGQRASGWQPKHSDKMSPTKKPKAMPYEMGMSKHYLEALRQLAERLVACIVYARKKNRISTRAQEIYDYIKQHHKQSLRVADLAAHLHMSASRTAHVVKEETGQSWTELLLQERLRTACRLLEKTEAGIVQIALNSGFGDQSQFQKIFKRHFGMTPGRYRRSPQMRA